MRMFIALFVGISLIIIGVGWSQILEQQHKINVSLTTTGVIKYSSVNIKSTTDSKGRRSTTYEPGIQYTYTVADKQYESKSVFPVTVSTTQARAREITDAMPAGKSVTVWYDPADPSSAFLLREYDFTPYIFTLFPMIHLCVGLGVAMAYSPRKRALPPPVPTTGGWFSLPIKNSVKSRQKPWRIIAFLWWLAGLLAAGHYFLIADRPYQSLAFIVTSIYAFVGLVPLAFLYYYARLSRNLREATLLTNTQTFKPGQTFNLRLEQNPLRPLTIHKLRIGLICDHTHATISGKRTYTHTQPCFENWIDAPTPEQASPATPIQSKATFTIPSNQPPSTLPENRTPDRHAWRIAVEIQIAGVPDYKASFPIKVFP